MLRIATLTSLCLGLLTFSALAADPAPFQLLYRQGNVISDGVTTTSDLMITVVNLGGGEARDLMVSIPVQNPYLFVDSPVFLTTIPEGRQAEVLHFSEMPDDLIALSESESDLVWRIAYTAEDDSRVSVEIMGVKGN
ncbi:MAG: hypothetical protein IH614_01165 [Desulfuromonadales bacterium]|nr:hypothetical protein [Desulfuromonadales bacterium]